MTERFYWLIEHSIAGCARPGGPDSAQTRAPGAASWSDPRSLDSDLAWLRQQGIEAILSLTETPLPQDVLDRHGLESLHLPVPDMTAPFPEQFARALDFIDLQRGQGRGIVVHCLVGQGRTATILAAYLIRSGMGPDEAIAHLRSICPGAIGSPVQVRALHAFAERRHWIV